jgi:glutamate N-acetyltransferase/amino-acid N-acetyltransferase
VRTGVTAPLGFAAAATSCGLKPEGPDLALLVADRRCAAAAVFTTNQAQAAPVTLSRDHLEARHARAVVVNAGCANAGTGAQGVADAREMARTTARAIGCDPRDIVVASTGVIGVHLPMGAIRSGIARASESLSPENGALAARAILTTDTHPKEVVVEFSLQGHTARVGAMAKGSGMIAPRMATLLAFFTTDAGVEPRLLDRAFRDAIGSSLNRITVDGDTSTNDMALILSSGALAAQKIVEDGDDFNRFRGALAEASRQIAGMIVRDGEGATRVAEITVEGAREAAEADTIARAVAESSLVKTALHGGDPNWGRILAAVGRAGVVLDMSGVDLFLGQVWVAEGGRARPYDEDQAHQALLEDPVRIRIRLSEGHASGFMWTCDLTRGYVEINAHYRS